jgi:hypothetical protein
MAEKSNLWVYHKKFLGVLNDASDSEIRKHKAQQNSRTEKMCSFYISTAATTLHIHSNQYTAKTSAHKNFTEKHITNWMMAMIKLIHKAVIFTACPWLKFLAQMLCTMTYQ